MYILTNKDDVVFHISETKNYQANGNVLVDNDTLAIPPILIKEIFEVEEIPAEIQTYKYCYTAEKGFCKNENYREPELSDTEKIKQLQEQVTDLQLALAEMYESEVQNMAKVYYSLIKKGLRTIEEIPQKLRQAVQKLLDEEE